MGVKIRRRRLSVSQEATVPQALSSLIHWRIGARSMSSRLIEAG